MGFAACYPLFLWTTQILRYVTSLMVLHLWIPSTVPLPARSARGNQPPNRYPLQLCSLCRVWLAECKSGDWREGGGVQGSNPPQTQSQSQSKGLFSLQSSSNLAQNPTPPTGVHRQPANCLHITMSIMEQLRPLTAISYGSETLWLRMPGT